jgi:hypothetical protein
MPEIGLFGSGGGASPKRRPYLINLRVLRSPIRPHADTPTPVLGGCGSAVLCNLWFAPISEFRFSGGQPACAGDFVESLGSLAAESNSSESGRFLSGEVQFLLKTSKEL